MADQKSIARVRELAWAAGLFEGEGCITHNGHRGAKLLPKLILVSADEDVVHRFRRAVGNIGYVRVRAVRSIKTHLPHWKDTWEWRVVGHEKAQAVIAFLWFGLGARRRAKAREILAWNATGAPEHAFTGSRGRTWSTRGGAHIPTVKNLTTIASTD
jgi:hypothetical protein